jgi:hypothetical protein
MAVAASLVVEVRFQMASIEMAQRQAVMPLAGLPTAATQTSPAATAPAPPLGRLRTLGRAMLDLADAGISVVR